MPGTPASDWLVSGEWRTSVANPWTTSKRREKITEDSSERRAAKTDRLSEWHAYIRSWCVRYLIDFQASQFAESDLCKA